MKAVSNIFKLQRLLFRLPQFLQIQGMLGGLGFMGQPAFKDFEGKTSA